MPAEPSIKPPNGSSKYGNLSFRRCCARYLVPFVIVLVSSFLYVSRQSISRESCLTNIDAQNFWQNRHPQLGQSNLGKFLNNPASLATCSDAFSSEHDSRLIPALWLDLIGSKVEGDSQIKPLCSKGVCQSDEVRLPFRWGSFLGLDRENGPKLDLTDCSQLRSLIKGQSPQNESYSAFLIDQIVSEECEIKSPMSRPLTENIRRYIGANYMSRNRQIPEKIVILTADVSKKSTSPYLATQVGLYEDTIGDKDIKELASQVSETNGGNEEISISKQTNAFRKVMNKISNKNSSSSDAKTLNLTAEDFYGKDPLSSADEQAPTYKYFHEAELSGTHLGYHYDWRFFQKQIANNYERKVVLHRLAKAWLRFSYTFGLKSWLAHGSLLGWYWNGLNLPWDQDIDVQMPYMSFTKLAAHNQSLILDLVDDPDIAGVHSYFLDVNPHFKNRIGDKENVVDARFIDTHTGMYVDITALAISPKSELHRSFEADANSRLLQVFDANYKDEIRSATLDPKPFILDEYHKQLEKKASNSWHSKHLYNCKDFHFYHLEELGPLIETSFEGETAYVPRNFKNILQREYPKGLTSKCHGDWLYRPFFGVWTPLSKCPNDLYGDKCNDRDMILEEGYTRPYRLKRGHWNNSVKQSPRVDPCILERNQGLNSKDREAH
ncbi:hypothetical protein OXX80_005729 [Metschnikowia pulcherrima]